MGYQNALLFATEYRRCESRLTRVEPQLGVTPQRLRLQENPLCSPPNNCQQRTAGKQPAKHFE